MNAIWYTNEPQRQDFRNLPLHPSDYCSRPEVNFNKLIIINLQKKQFSVFKL